MTIFQARKILGVVAQTLTDEQIQAIINCYKGIIDVGFEQFEKKYKKEYCNGKNKIQ